MKKNFTKLFIDEKYSNSPKKNNETNNLNYKFFDQIRSIDLADMIDYKSPNNKGFRKIFLIFDKLSVYTGCVPLKNKLDLTITDDLSNLIQTSKQKPIKVESDRGAEFYKNIFSNFLES